jgi:membrane-associated phospholipid phosphatase
MEDLYQFEIWVILWIQNLGNWLVEPMRWLSTLGNEEFYLTLMPLLYWCISSVLGLRMGLMLLLSNTVNAFFKLAFHSPRPFWYDPRVNALMEETSFGIPSGHAQNAASIWGLLAGSYKSKWFRIGLVFLIFLIGFSRWYLGMHFLRDVVLGWVLGGALLFLFLKVEAPLMERLRGLSLARMLALALASALVLAGIILLPHLFLKGWQAPAVWQENALLDLPDLVFNPLKLDDAFTVAGTWFGMLAGVAWLYHRQGGLFDASGTPLQRLLRYLVGSVGIIIFWYLLGKIFPREADVLSYMLRFARYTLIGLWVSVLAPLLFQRLGLAQAPKMKSSSLLKSQENPL